MEIKEKIWSRNEKMAYLFLDYSIALAKKRSEQRFLPRCKY